MDLRLLRERPTHGHLVWQFVSLAWRRTKRLAVQNSPSITPPASSNIDSSVHLAASGRYRNHHPHTSRDQQLVPPVVRPWFEASIESTNRIQELPPGRLPPAPLRGSRTSIPCGIAVQIPFEVLQEPFQTRENSR